MGGDECIKSALPLRSFRHDVSSSLLNCEVTRDWMRLLEDQVNEVKEGAFRIASRKKNVGIEKNSSQDLNFLSLRRSPFSAEANSAILFSEYISIGTLTDGRRRIPSGVCSAIKWSFSSIPKARRSFAGMVMEPRRPTVIVSDMLTVWQMFRLSVNLLCFFTCKGR